MDTTAVTIALIALAGSILSTIVTVFGAPAFQARRDARKVLETYREPPLAASYELQARLHNILRNNFIDDWVGGKKGDKTEAALTSTLYVFAQFFGWLEVIRREVQLLRFESNAQTREISRLLQAIGETFLSDDFGPQFMLWRVEQRGLGERMIIETNGKSTCIGYATFITHQREMAEWLEPLERDLTQPNDAGRQRLTRVQHLLLDLVTKLDEKHTRYPFKLEYA